MLAVVREHDHPSVADLAPSVRTRWAIACLVLLAGTVAGLVYALPNLDGHPLVLALSFSWLVNVVVSAVTRGFRLQVDPARFGFARWEREGRVYERVGVRAFQRLIRGTPLGWLNPFLNDATNPQRLLREIGYAEGGHLICGCVSAGAGVLGFVTGHVGVGLWLGIVAVPVHVYPIMLQRWNRGRVLRMSRR